MPMPRAEEAPGGCPEAAATFWAVGSPRGSEDPNLQRAGPCGGRAESQHTSNHASYTPHPPEASTFHSLRVKAMWLWTEFTMERREPTHLLRLWLRQGRLRVSGRWGVESSRGADPVPLQQLLPSTLMQVDPGCRSACDPVTTRYLVAPPRTQPAFSFGASCLHLPEALALILTRTAKPASGPCSHFIVLR